MNQAGMHVGGRYRLEVLLGRGGMGEVWRAYDPRLDRRVAIKFLPAHLATGNGQLLDRFHREARITARLQHPGIAAVFDSGAQDGQLHLVMELLDGRNLGDLLAEKPSGLPLAQAVDLTAQAAAALSYAHGADIVHRDIKPANLMLLPGGRLKVCDFGIAGFVRADSGLTREGVVMGTPGYMAPEQCRGRRVDGRADLYALGCVLFALLTGGPPFADDRDFYAVLMDHIATPPPRLAALRPRVPDELDRLAGQLLAKDPAERPAFAGVVADRLRALGREDASAAAAPPRPDPRVAYAPRPAPGPSAPDAEPPAPTPALGLDVYYNDHLVPGATEANAIITVEGTALSPDDLAATAPRALVFLAGFSTDLPQADLDAIRQSLAETVDALDEGVSFGIVAGSEYARMLYPDTMRLVRADAVTKAEARAALTGGLAPVRAAAFGRWLRLADRLLAGHADAVRTAILLVDMEATAESPEELAATLASCSGRFSCHARGIGGNWAVRQLTSIASALSGTVNIVPTLGSPAEAPALAAELAPVIDQTRRSVARDLAMRITRPDGTRLRFLKQVDPQVEDLTDRGHPVAPGADEFPIDLPDNASRDYHLCLDLPRGGQDGDTITAADVEVVLLPPAGDGQALVRQAIPYRWVRDG
ncbi:protein kinase [Streptomyces sp. NPDC059009]|uniref:serine/threonine-protein kinase n=1 Tax=Streptomyces sp. NPDC059009 TaxID=3346694 RepID=UPI0036ADBD0E